MSLLEYLKELSKIYTSYVTSKKANIKKNQTSSIKKLDKKVGNLEKSLKKHLLINILVATIFFILGLLAPTLFSYFSNLMK